MRLTRLAAATLVVAGMSIGPIAATPDSFRIYTETPGVHRVSFEDLVAKGLGPEPIASDLLSLRNRDRLLPVLMHDGEDGAFGPGDTFEFVADTLHGATTHFHPYSQQNVYWLEWQAAQARRYSTAPSGAPGATGAKAAAAGIEAEQVPIELARRVHLEQDRLLIRLNRLDLEGEREPELWYWAKLTHISKQPFTLDLEMADRAVATPWRLRVGLRGLSAIPDAQRDEGVKDHLVEVSTGGQLIGRASWNGKRPFVLERAQVVGAAIKEGFAEPLEIRVVRQRSGGEPVIDVVMLDWVEFEYQSSGEIAAEQVEFRVPAGQPAGIARFGAPGGRRLEIFGADHRSATLDAEGTAIVALPSRAEHFWLRQDGAALAPVAIDRNRPSDLKSYDHQADYLMIAHSSLLEATRDLATFHRRRGLTVELIDVQDIYDEFNGGIVDPVAIRDFIAHTYYNWRSPRPRFVLLVGDASWDTKNATVDDSNYANWVGRQLVHGERFRAMKQITSGPAASNDRGLIPSWSYHTLEGHAASDVYFTQMDRDELPDLAIGRLPVTDPEDVRAITAKVIRYVDEPPLGPWRRRVVWIAGALRSHQLRSTQLADSLAGWGRSPTMVLPAEEARPEDRARIVEAFDDGNVVTHFIGHGGRFIWRTGPPDLSDQIDLFGLEELALLEPNPRLPVVLSVACYSAPFDHPSADSIGEAFVRLPDRGAIAFIGASWRNAPPRELSRLLVEKLLQPGTVGEALMDVKRQIDRSEPIHLFNLLGDPALPVTTPGHEVEIDVQRVGNRIEVTAQLPATAVGGRLELDYLGPDGTTLSTHELAVTQQQLNHALETDQSVVAVTAYFWNEATGSDGVGAARPPAAENEKAARARTRP